ncbi:MAG: FISUMP domain-containing protein [Bacteroidales bacterium]|nr:FISUMP domain-containing protein [Bacteroidales bacterium]MDD4500268.1 FISUMP domain-containing protein [Bacteroidales bacterium]
MKKTIVYLLTIMCAYSCTPLEAPYTFGMLVDNRDGNRYKTVIIGDQLWTVDNMAYLPSVSSYETVSSSDDHYYVYEYYGTDVEEAKATDNYKTYGVLYNWSAAKTACPEGWHLPSDAEWNQLENYLIANKHNYDGTTSGNKLAISVAKANNWTSSSNVGTPGNIDYPEYRNKSGFSALPGGLIYSIERGSTLGGLFSSVGDNGYWWSSTRTYKYTFYFICIRTLSYDSESFSSSSIGSDFGLSVRCIKD